MTSTSSSSISITSSQVHYAQFGRCQNIKTGKTRCAISPLDCEQPSLTEHGEKWYNALRLKEKGINEPPCACKDTLMGACTFVGGQHMKYQCAPRPHIKDDYCRPEEKDDGTGAFIDPIYDILATNPTGTNCFCDAFKSADTGVMANNHTFTSYGACYIPNDNDNEKQFFCAYSSEYCTNDHIWVHPNDLPTILGKDDGYCNCENTHIGGCVGGFQDFHCGVTELDCRTNAFVPPIALKEEYNHACFLCDGNGIQASLKIMEEQDEIDVIKYVSSNYKLVGIRIGIIVVSIIASALSVFMLVTWSGRMRRRKNRQQQETQSNENDNNNATAGDAVTSVICHEIEIL